MTPTEELRRKYARHKRLWDWASAYAIAMVAGSVVGVVSQFVRAVPRNDDQHAAFVWGILAGLLAHLVLWFYERAEPK